jgi:hypothetical protein
VAMADQWSFVSHAPRGSSDERTSSRALFGRVDPVHRISTGPSDFHKPGSIFNVR